MDVEEEHQGRPGQLLKPVLLATRKSPLALAQTGLVADRLRSVLGVATEERRIVTTGDRQAAWSLEKQGGKGLFTAELEAALLSGEADVAVHSTKDLPGESTPGLAVAGYLPRADARDVLVLRAGVGTPVTIATDSPRRRLQISRIYPRATFAPIRGNVDTRLKKLVAGAADATILAAAGLARLGIHAWEGAAFHPLDPADMVPAVGQGAIAVQCRQGEADRFAPALDLATGRAVAIERAIQHAIGGGCQSAFGAHVAGGRLYFYHERIGARELPLAETDFDAPAVAAKRILAEVGWNA